MARRFVRPQEWQENTIGHKAERAFLKLIVRLGIQAEKGSDFEDLFYGADFWIRFRGHSLPVQLTCESGRVQLGRKVQKAKRFGVALVQIPFHDLSSSLAYRTAAERVINSLRKQLDDYLTEIGAPRLTRQECYQAEMAWVSRNGNTFQPQKRSA